MGLPPFTVKGGGKVAVNVDVGTASIDEGAGGQRDPRASETGCIPVKKAYFDQAASGNGNRSGINPERRAYAGKPLYGDGVFDVELNRDAAGWETALDWPLVAGRTSGARPRGYC